MMVVMIALVFWILLIIARWKIFTKAGEAGWKSIIPIYSDYVQWRIGWKKTGMFWLMIALILVGCILGFMDGSFVAGRGGSIQASGSYGIMGIIGTIMILVGAILELISVYKLFKSYGRSVGWFIGYIFIPHIMLLVLAFGSAQYEGPQE